MQFCSDQFPNIEMLNLHQTIKSRDSNEHSCYITQSTELAHQLFKHKVSNSITSFMDPERSTSIQPIHFIQKFTQHSAIKLHDLRSLYSDLIEKILHQENLKASFDQICTEFPCINPIYYQSCDQNYEIVFRIWYIKNSNQISSRILYIAPYNSLNTDITLFYQVFGNIDVAMIPYSRDYYHEVNLVWLDYKNIQQINQLSIDSIIKISKYLDHGQSLNLRTVDKLIYPSHLKQALSIHSRDAYLQHLQDYYHHQQKAPNARSLSSFPSVECVTHLTKFKDEIIKSGTISTSNGGCLGNVIYSVKVLKDSKDQQYIGGMSIGLMARLYSTTSLNPDPIFLFSIKEPLNFLSNWINSFGFGRLKLEAMLQTAQQPQYSLIIHQSCQIALFLYKEIQPLLVFFKNYCAKRSWIQTLDERKQALLIKMEFKEFWSLFTAKRVLSENPYEIQHFYLLNNILFETLKDYMLLHQTTNEQLMFNELGSYDMHNQYQFFFSLDPDLKDLGFKTEFFAPNYPSILEHLAKHNAFNYHSKTDELRLQKFLLNRFSATINIFFLEYKNIPKIKSSIFTHQGHCLHPFMEQACVLPNLCGNIIHSVLSKPQQSSTMMEKFIQKYNQKLRNMYDLSYNESNINVPIKANLFETDEIGIRQIKSTSIHNIQLTQEQESLYKIMEISEPLSIQLNGVSSRVQLREKECTSPNTSCLMHGIRTLQKNITEWDELSLQELKLLLTQKTLSYEQIQNSGLSNILFCFFYESHLNFQAYEQTLTYEKIILDFNYIILMQEIFHLLNVKSYHAAREKLNNFVSIKGTSHTHVMNILLQNAKDRGELYTVLMLYFRARYVFNKVKLDENYIAEIMNSVLELIQTKDPKVKTLLTQLLIYLTRQQHINCTSLILNILSCEQQKEQDPTLGIYHEVANFIRFFWRSLKTSDLVLFTHSLLDLISTEQELDSVINALTNISILPNLRSIFIDRFLSLLPTKKLQSPNLIESTLTILFNISMDMFPRKINLLNIANCNLSTTQFFHINRQLIEHPTDELNFTKTTTRYDFNTLLNTNEINSDESNTLSFVTHKKLQCLSSMSIFAQKICENFTESSVIRSYRGIT